MSVIQRLAAFFKRGASGATASRKLNHPYFGNMTYFEFKWPVEPYWEADVSIAEPPGKVGVTLTGTPDGPTDAEVQYCKSVLADLDALFERCRPALREPFEEWTSKRMPDDWRADFEIDGFSVPRGADPTGEWEVTYFVESASHWFTAVLRRGDVVDVRVEG